MSLDKISVVSAEEIKLFLAMGDLVGDYLQILF